MKDMQQLGGYAAFVAGLAFIAILALIFAVLPGLGVTMDSFSNPQAITKYGWALPAFNVLDVIFSAVILLLALALRERLQSGAPNTARLATILASVSSALFVGAGVAQLNGWPIILSSTGGGAPAIAAFYALGSGLESAAGFAASWATLFWGWGALATKTLPNLLSYLFIASGVLGIVGTIPVPALALLGLIGLVLNVVWAFWLGTVLLQRQTKKKR